MARFEDWECVERHRWSGQGGGDEGKESPFSSGRARGRIE